HRPPSSSGGLDRNSFPEEGRFARKGTHEPPLLRKAVLGNEAVRENPGNSAGPALESGYDHLEPKRTLQRNHERHRERPRKGNSPVGDTLALRGRDSVPAPPEQRRSLPRDKRPLALARGRTRRIPEQLLVHLQPGARARRTGTEGREGIACRLREPLHED